MLTFAGRKVAKEEKMELNNNIKTAMIVANKVANYNNHLARAIDELKSITHRYGFHEENCKEISNMITKLEKMSYSDYEMDNYLKNLQQ